MSGLQAITHTRRQLQKKKMPTKSNSINKAYKSKQRDHIGPSQQNIDLLSF